MPLPSEANYHSRRGDLGQPKELMASSRQREPSEFWPCTMKSFAFGEHEDQFLSSFCGNAAIPQLPPDETPRTRMDHRLGPHDMMLYPQRWNHLAPHHAWIERRELHRNLHKGHIVAYVFQNHDWTPVSAGSIYGRISSDLMARLKEAFYEIHLLVLPLFAQAKTRHLLPTLTVSECMRLLSDLDTLNSTFWESARQVTRIQRGIAELLAFRLFRLDVQYHVGDQLFVSDRIFDYVGVFTSDEAMAILFHRLGIPVYVILRGLPKSVARTGVTRAVPWSIAVDKQTIYLSETGEWSLGEQTIVPESTRGNPAPLSYLPRSLSPPSRSDRGRSPRRAYKSPSARSRSPPRPSRYAKDRGRSPAPGARHDPSHQRMSKYPRYILYEQPRISDEGIRQHPDAPDRWRPRTWSTDPGHQSSVDYELPDWAPQLPVWLREIAKSVDRSVTREWRLSAVDAVNPVPQDIFTRPLEYMLPPLHLLMKHEKRFVYVIKSWAALRDFWLRKIMDIDARGLPASTWRKVLDDKYHISKDLASWIATQSTVQSLATVDAEEDVTTVDEAPDLLETVNRRVSFLSKRLQDELSHQRTMGGSLSTSRRYTRAPESGEDLPATSTRASAEPAGWGTRSHQIHVFCETRSRCMILLDATALAVEMSGPARWDEYWDYENSRILLFNRDSGVPEEHSCSPDGEILLHDDVLSWHTSPKDESGVCHGTRAMWCASGGLLTDKSGKLLEFRSATSNSTQHCIASVHMEGSRWDDSATETVLPQRPLGLPLSSHGTAPPPDPVYGYAQPLPNGHEITQFIVRHCVLAPADLSRPEVRAFLVWELEEAGFRFQLRRTDNHILRSLGVWTREIQTQRDAIIQQCWGGTDGFVPSGMGIPAHINPDPRQRVASIYNFWKLVRSWPRVRDVTNLRRFTQHEGLSMKQLIEVESEVWKFYAQTFYDYFGILPTLPKLMPINPFISPDI